MLQNEQRLLDQQLMNEPNQVQTPGINIENKPTQGNLLN